MKIPAGCILPLTSQKAGRRSFRVSSFLTARMTSGLPRSTRNFGKEVWKSSRNCSNWSAILRAWPSPALLTILKWGELTSIQESFPAARLGAARAVRARHTRRRGADFRGGLLIMMKLYLSVTVSQVLGRRDVG